jgi:Ca2+/Na+ antiporter
MIKFLPFILLLLGIFVVVLGIKILLTKYKKFNNLLKMVAGLGIVAVGTLIIREALKAFTFLFIDTSTGYFF